MCMEINAPKYIRLGRADAKDIYHADSKFEIGKSNTFGCGTDGTIFAVGNTLSVALDAKEELKKQNIDVRVVDLYSIKIIYILQEYLKYCQKLLFF